ncbi:MAG: putative LPS assembly protein LptD [Candidatus Delongbacteria bacterium]
MLSRGGAGLLLLGSLAPALALAAPSRGASFNPQDYLTGSGYTTKLDSVVTYTADSLFMDARSRRTHLSGASTLNFLNMKLDSPEILVDWEHDQVEAWSPAALAEADSCGGALHLGAGQSLQASEPGRGGGRAAPEAPADSTAAPPLPWPVFSDGAQTMYGRHMSLNIQTRQGFIRDGRAAEAPSLYGGTRIKRVADQELHVADAVFTTCDEGCPHYHFQARQLKMLLKDKVFARDVTLHFGLVPTLYSPVALFSLKRGRSSGLILPSYGQTAQQGRKLDHLGWYWAAADTWDTQVRVSYAENGPDWLFENTTRYKWNAQEKGQLSGSYNITQTSLREGWDLRWNHDQALTPYVSFRSNVKLASSKQYYEDNSDNLETRLSQSLSSSLNLSGRFPESGVTWTLNGSGTQNLESGLTTGSLPTLDLSFPTWSPLRFLAPLAVAAGSGSQAGRGLREWLGGSTLKLASRAESRYSMDKLHWMDAENTRGARHSVSFSVPGKVGVFSLTPNVSAASVWVDETSELVRRADGSLDTVQVAGFAARQTFSTTLAGSTQLYGSLYPRIGRLEALRHVLSPSLSASWTPDFSDSRWGYVQSARQGDSLDVRLDRFRGAIYGGTPSRESLLLNMSLGQLWQSKWSAPRTPADSLLADAESGGSAPAASGAPSIKTDLLRLSSTTSYDFKADSLRLGDLHSNWALDPLQVGNWRLGPISSLNMQLSTVHSPYQVVDSTGRRLARYTWQDGPRGRRLPWLSSTSVTVSTRLAGGSGGGSIQPAEVFDDEDTDRFAPRFGSADLSIPWSLTSTWSWSLNRSIPDRPSKQSHVDLRGSLNLSRHWKLSSGVHYDLVARSFSSQSINIYRDMHCWEGYFQWNPRSDSYHLLIHVKSDFLEDLKWDKRKGRSGSYSSF